MLATTYVSLCLIVSNCDCDCDCVTVTVHILDCIEHLEAGNSKLKLKLSCKFNFLDGLMVDDA